jgi:hypothetical protein
VAPIKLARRDAGSAVRCTLAALVHFGNAILRVGRHAVTLYLQKSFEMAEKKPLPICL